MISNSKPSKYIEIFKKNFFKIDRYIFNSLILKIYNHLKYNLKLLIVNLFKKEVNFAKKHNLRKKLIVSLTSYPKRFRTLPLVLNSISNQTVLPDKIILWIENKDKKKLPQTLTVDQTIRLVDIKDKSLLGKRDHAILELFYSSGLRLSELTNLQIEDISFNEENIRVTGKGNKSRIIPVGKSALPLFFNKYLRGYNLTEIVFNEEKSPFVFELDFEGAYIDNLLEGMAA